MTNIIYKKKAERFPVTVDFSNVLETGETLITGSFVRAFKKSTDEEVSSSILDLTEISYNSSSLQAVIISGSDDITYRLAFKSITSTDNVYEENVFIIVEKDE